jgi:hypothetical protein
MKLTIDDYIQLNYELRNNLNQGIDNLFDWATTEYNVSAVQRDVADRMTFDISTKYIKAYNISSQIVPLNNGTEIYHIIDLSMFGYFNCFFECYVHDMPNLLVAYYKMAKA